MDSTKALSFSFFFVEDEKLAARMPCSQDMQDTLGALEFEGGECIIRSIFNNEIENNFATCFSPVQSFQLLEMINGSLPPFRKIVQKTILLAGLESQKRVGKLCNQRRVKEDIIANQPVVVFLSLFLQVSKLRRQTFATSIARQCCLRFNHKHILFAPENEIRFFHGAPSFMRMLTQKRLYIQQRMFRHSDKHHAGFLSDILQTTFIHGGIDQSHRGTI